jgi:PAS domain S-box-containing protein
MIPNSLFRGEDGLWNGAIIGSAVAVLLLNLSGLFLGITAVFPHLLYIPVVLAAYRYPRRGLPFSLVIAVIYLLMVILIIGPVPVTIAEATIRGAMLVVIGGLIAFVTRRLREQESLYQGLFDHSAAGSILVRDSGEGWRVVEANENALALLHRSRDELRNAPLTRFWSEDRMAGVFSRLAEEGKVFASENTFFGPDGSAERVLVSLATVPDKQAVLTFVEITRRVNAEESLQRANDKLNLLARISTDHLHRTANEIIETVDEARMQSTDPVAGAFLTRVRLLALNLARQIFLSETYKDLGTRPPDWVPVQRVLEGLARANPEKGVSMRFWTERLEVYADPLFGDVLTHIVENSLRHGGTLKNLVVTYHRTPDGMDLMIQDDGIGIPTELKEKIFEYDSGGHAGLGLFICRQILDVTGISVTENGNPGEGARFVLHIPKENYRIEGSFGEVLPFSLPSDPAELMLRGAVHKSGTRVRELASAEFPVAEELWIEYHHTKGNPETDRIFAAFSDGRAVSVARCKCHPDGMELDGVYTPDDFRGHGYANAAVWGLVEACGHDTMYMHSVANLTGFYGHYGFVLIPEHELPDTIRERYAWAQGEMEGANVAPMKRPATE